MSVVLEAIETKKRGGKLAEGVVREVVAGATLPDRRHRQVLIEDVRAAREQLSNAEQAEIPLPGGASAAWCSRGELEDLLRGPCEGLVALLAREVATAAPGCSPRVRAISPGPRLNRPRASGASTVCQACRTRSPAGARAARPPLGS